MSSPYEDGTKSSTVFSSKDIDILAEIIQINIDKEFQTAKFTVEYSLKSDIAGKQIPLLFYARDYKDSFNVWVDNQKINLQNIPKKYIHIEDSPFGSFSNAFEKNNFDDNDETVAIHWYKSDGDVCRLNDLKYFETNLNKGTHKIRVEYTANVWVDLHEWIKQYSFRYSLTPAKFWKSFGTLNIEVEQTGTLKKVTTNLGEPTKKEISGKNIWNFNKLPDEYIALSYTPKVNIIAKTLIAIEPFGLSIILGLLLFTIHLRQLKIYRANHLQKRYSKVVVIGSVLVTLAILFCYMFSFDLIDYAIGEHASKYHGYVFLVLVLYPILLPIYWTVLWLLDKNYKARLLKQM